MADVPAVLARLDGQRSAATALLADLVRIPSENPPGDTRALARFVCDWLAARGHTPRVVAAREDLPNIVCTLRGARPGRALVLNGHLDTYPAGDRAAWSVDPFGGVVRDGKLYGRGVGDMKAGVAAHLLTFAALADVARDLAGRLTLTLVSDEENGGALGAGHLLGAEPEARGDACLIGDAGAADVICFAEKGAVWADLSAKGRGAHSAHVHKGRNAIHALVGALRDVMALDGLDVGVPDAVRVEVERGRAETDAAFGEGATAVLGRVTVTVGLVEGGRKRNLVPDAARAEVDLRIPAGGSTGPVLRALDAVARRHGVEVAVLSAKEPHWSPPDSAIFGALRRATERVRGRPAPLAGRIGASDARYFRPAGIPTAVYGPAVANMGGPDEHVDLDEWWDVVRVHVTAALDLLAAGGTGR